MNLSFRRLASSIALAGVAGLAGTATACSSAPGTDPGGSSEFPARKIDATALASVPAGQSLVLDMSRPDIAYDIDCSAAPIDFSRIDMHFAPGRDVTMMDWLAQTAVDGRDAVSRNAGHFILGSVSSEEQPEIISDQPAPGCKTLCSYLCDNSQPRNCHYECFTNCP